MFLLWNRPFRVWPSGCVLRSILVAFEDYSHCVRARSASVGCRRYDFHSRYKGTNLSLRFSNVSPTFFVPPRIFLGTGWKAVILVKVKMVKIENRCCQNRHYNINIYIYIYSEQMTAFPKSKMTILTMTTLTTFLEYSLLFCTFAHRNSTDPHLWCTQDIGLIRLQIKGTVQVIWPTAGSTSPGVPSPHHDTTSTLATTNKICQHTHGVLAVQTRDFSIKVCTFHNYSLSLQTKTLKHEYYNIMNKHKNAPPHTPAVSSAFMLFSVHFVSNNVRRVCNPSGESTATSRNVLMCLYLTNYYS